ncbi:hypothetical protein EAN04_24540 [Salmonella enterica]|nr:hypothetical protein [Salmonella enterica]
MKSWDETKARVLADPVAKAAYDQEAERLQAESDKPQFSYTLEELLAGWPENYEPSAEDLEWLNMKPVGDEIW